MFPEVRVVEASAGSGKTYALAKRYIQLLINPSLRSDEIPLRNILAITFTHKATRQMRERIFEQLKKIAFNSFSNNDEKKDLLDAVGISTEKAQEKAYLVLDHIIHHYNFFQVKNIDSFINVILSGCAAELKLSANFRIKENYSNYVSYALDECIDSVETDSETAAIFENFLRQYLFLENRTGWFPKSDVLDILNGLFSQSNIYGGSFEKFPVQDKELIVLKQKVLTLLHQIYDQKPEGINKRFINTLATFLRNNVHGFNIADLDKKSFQTDVLPMNKGHEASSELTMLWDEFRRTIVALSKKEALSLFNCYIDIFNRVYNYFREYARKDDVVFMEELNKQARVLFEEVHLSVPELYYRLANRFRHFLIDEFQDTSKLQWDNLHMMIEDALSSGGSLFYVGDKKQAIYRFRGGNVSLFDGIKQDFSQFNVNDKLPLRINYRSHKEIVSFNNEIFSQQNLKRFIEAQQANEKDNLRQFSDSEVSEILEGFKDSQQEHILSKQHGFVNVSYIEYIAKEERDELIKESLLEHIKNLKKRFPLKSIAILCRSNREIEWVTGWLSEEKINVESERTLNILNNPLVQEIISFLKFLNSPIDTISFASFILGDIFLNASGLDKEEITDFIFRFNRDKKGKSGYLYREFRKLAPEIWDEYIAEFFKNVGFVSLYELLISVLDKFRVLENFPGVQGYFMRLLELVIEQEEEHPDISLFLIYLSNAPDQHLYVNFSDENAVKVMTIHKAKGLGFSVVLVPFLSMNIRELGTQTRRSKASYVVYPKPNDGLFGLVRLDSKYAKFSQLIRNIYTQEYVKSFIDELNVIYVTFTRAQNELYVFIPHTASSRSNAVKFLMPEGVSSRGTQVEYSVKEVTDNSQNMVVSVPKYKDWIASLKEEFTVPTQLCNRKSIQRGEILHAMLAQIGNLEEIDVDDILNILSQKLKQELVQEEELDSYINTIKKIITTTSTKDFFFLKNSKVFQEKEFVDCFGFAKRIDRLIITENEVWIVDYKSSKENSEEHLAQVKEYIKIVSEIYKGKKIKGFLLYMDHILVEEVM